jgi:hypothetical protein
LRLCGSKGRNQAYNLPSCHVCVAWCCQTDFSLSPAGFCVAVARWRNPNSSAWPARCVRGKAAESQRQRLCATRFRRVAVGIEIPNPGIRGLVQSAVLRSTPVRLHLSCGGELDGQQRGQLPVGRGGASNYPNCVLPARLKRGIAGLRPQANLARDRAGAVREPPRRTLQPALASSVHYCVRTASRVD